MNLTRHISKYQNINFEKYNAWHHDGVRLGFVTAAIEQICIEEGIFQKKKGILSTSIVNKRKPIALTEKLFHLKNILIERSILNPSRNELFPLKAHPGGKSLGEIDRQLTPVLGTLTEGVHLNGFFCDGQDLKMWVARRAKHRIAFPGRLDNLVGGGQPSGITIYENLKKESHEEAGIPLNLLSKAISVGCVNYSYSDSLGLRRDTLYIYDLKLDPAFKPVCNDGEVETFSLLNFKDVLQIVTETDEFKSNCNLIIIDFAIRHGFLNPDQNKDYLSLCNGLRQLKDI